ncbi:MAG TPA: hypothetical protein VG943_04185 [Caulobacterales bacterium]|nr:hypothetical protein [Caulobacterales bacterium]
MHHFPSFWLIIAAGLGPLFVYGLVLGIIKRPAFNAAQTIRTSDSDAVNLLSILATPGIFWALTGSFPTTYFIVAAALYVLTGAIIYLVYRAAGLPREKRVAEMGSLTAVFFRPTTAVVGCLTMIVIPAGFIWMLVQAYHKAKTVELTSASGLFEVAVLLFGWQALVTMGLSVAVGAITLSSSHTPKQQRFTVLCATFRSTVLACWTLGYPFYAFRQSYALAHLDWALWGLGVCGAIYLLAVAIPFQLGWGAFNRKQRQRLTLLQENVDTIRQVLADPVMPPDFKQLAVRKQVEPLRDVYKQIVQRYSFFGFLAQVSRLSHDPEVQQEAGNSLPTPALGQLDMAASPGAPCAADYDAMVEQMARKPNQFSPASDWERIAVEERSKLPTLDYRLFLLNALEDVFENLTDPGRLSFVALQIRNEIKAWQDQPKGRSLVLTAAGSLVSFLIPVVKSAAESAFKPQIDAIFNTIAIQVSAILH